MGNIILGRQAVVCLEEENGFATRPTTPFTYPVYTKYQDFSVSINPTYVMTEVADGGRMAARKQIVGMAPSWSITMEVHPKLLGWFLKWGVGSQIVVTSGERYQYSPVAVNVEQDSFSMYVDYQVGDLWGDGEQTVYLLGCKIGNMRIEGVGSGDDHRVLVTLEGLAQKLYGSSNTVLTGLAPLHYARTLLYNSVHPTPYMFKGHIANYNAGGWSSTNKWGRFAIEVTNNLIPQIYSDENKDVFISDINTGGQSVRAEFDKEFLSSTEIDDAYALADAGKDIKFRVTHKDIYKAGGSDYYQMQFNIPRFMLDMPDPILQGTGGDGDAILNTFMGDAVVDHAVTDVDNTSATGTDHVIDIGDANTDYEANLFTTSAGGYLTYVTIPMKTDGSGVTGDSVCYIYSNSGGDPDSLVAGATSNTYKLAGLTTSYQTIPYFFPNHPSLSAATIYHAVIGGTSAVAGNLWIDGDTGGTNTHTASTDGGSTWAANDNDDWGHTVQTDDVALIVDLYSDGADTSNNDYPDAS